MKQASYLPLRKMAVIGWASANFNQMKKWIIEYKEYWFDCDVEHEEQTINVNAETYEEAKKIGLQELDKMDEKDNTSCGKSWDNEFNPLVRRSFYRCVELENHRYNSSAKETQLNGFQGHVDVTRWNGL